MGGVVSSGKRLDLFLVVSDKPVLLVAYKYTMDGINASILGFRLCTVLRNHFDHKTISEAVAIKSKLYRSKYHRFFRSFSQCLQSRAT